MSEFDGLQLVWLESFVKVARWGKRTAAAHDMGIEQSTVTKHIQKLELWLGGGGVPPARKLLISEGGKLLPDGDKFQPVAEQILALLKEARRSPGAVENPSPNQAGKSAKHIKVPPLRQDERND